jgi:hypothetical protein
MYFKTDIAGAYSSVNMTFTGGNNWTANIPAQSVGTTIYYYIHAEAISGKEQVRPITAPNGNFSFTVTGVNSIEDLSEDIFEAVFPNPSEGLTCIPLSNPIEFSGKLELLDQTGRLIEVIHEGTFVKGPRKYFLDVQALSSGMFYLVLTTPKGKFTQKLGVR